MKRLVCIIDSLLLSFFFLVISAVFSSSVHAQSLTCAVTVFPGTDMTYSADLTIPADLFPESDITVSVTTPLETNATDIDYIICEENQAVPYCIGSGANPTRNGTTFTRTFKASQADDGQFFFELWGILPGKASREKICQGRTFITRNVSNAFIPPDCSKFSVSDPSNLQFSLTTTALAVGFRDDGFNDNRRFRIRYQGIGMDGAQVHQNSQWSWRDADGSTFVFNVPNFNVSQITGDGSAVWLEFVDDSTRYCSIGLKFDSGTGSGAVTPVPTTIPGTTPSNTKTEPFNLCQQAGNYSSQCQTCLSNNGIWTAIGCIPFGITSSGEVSAVPTIQAFISIGLGIAGGVVVIMVLAGAFLLSTSQGDIKRVDEGKALITSAVIGLLFVVFSVTILRFIGVQILQLPGL